MAMNVVYDAGVLVAAERGDRRTWADHRSRLELGVALCTTAPVVAQVSRSPRQAQLRRFLRGCNVEAFAPEQAHAVGGLLGRTGTADVVDAHVVLTAAQRAASVLTSDPGDLRRLARRLPVPVPVRRI
jgi:hypothetical protein